MDATLIALEDAAVLENVKYNTLAQRIKRNPERYSTIIQPRENGGKPCVMLPLSSLSPQAQRKYKKSLSSVKAKASTIRPPKTEQPWYVAVDFNWFHTNHQEEYQQKLELRFEISCQMQRPVCLENQQRPFG